MGGFPILVDTQLDTHIELLFRLVRNESFALRPRLILPASHWRPVSLRGMTDTEGTEETGLGTVWESEFRIVQQPTE